MSSNQILSSYSTPRLNSAIFVCSLYTCITPPPYIFSDAFYTHTHTFTYSSYIMNRFFGTKKQAAPKPTLDDASKKVRTIAIAIAISISISISLSTPSTALSHTFLLPLPNLILDHDHCHHTHHSRYHHHHHYGYRWMNEVMVLKQRFASLMPSWRATSSNWLRQRPPGPKTS